MSDDLSPSSVIDVAPTATPAVRARPVARTPTDLVLARLRHDASSAHSGGRFESCILRRMDSYALPMVWSLVGGVLGLVQLVWQVAVIVFLYKIWVKVRHLPG